MKEHIIQRLRNELPPIFARSEVTRLTGGAVHHRTCANRDCDGTGVKGRYKVGKKVIYDRESFLDWLAPQLEEGGRDKVVGA